MGTYALTLKRVFNAPPQKVFNAWTDPKEVALWYGPEGFTNEVHEFNLVEGGVYRLTMHSPKGDQYTLRGVFKLIQPYEKLILTWQWEKGLDGGESNETTVTVDFKSADEGTEMTLTHEGFIDEEARKNHEMGWSSSFNDLEKHVTH